MKGKKRRLKKGRAGGQAQILAIKSGSEGKNPQKQGGSEAPGAAGGEAPY